MSHDAYLLERKGKLWKDWKVYDGWGFHFNERNVFKVKSPKTKLLL